MSGGGGSAGRFTGGSAGAGNGTGGGSAGRNSGAGNAGESPSGGVAASSGGNAGESLGGQPVSFGGTATAGLGGQVAPSGGVAAGGAPPSGNGGIADAGLGGEGGEDGAVGGTVNGGAAGSAGVPAGGASPRATCSWAGTPPEFGPPQSLGTPNTAASEFDPVLSHDGLSLYFVSYRDDKKGNDIYVATRPSATESFGAGALLAEANSSANDTHFFVGPDDLDAFLASDRARTTGSADILHSARASPAATWGAFASIDAINTSEGEFDPHLESDRLTLWFAPIGRLDGSGLQDLFFSVRADPTAQFGTPIPATNLNSPANEWDVSLTDDGLMILFQSDRDSARHVYYAIRPSRDAAFCAPAVVTALDPYLETLSDPFVAPDGCAVYFAAELASGAGGKDLYLMGASP